MDSPRPSRPQPFHEYEALVEKVDRSAEALHAVHESETQCRAGCDACCQVKLSLCPVEAEALRAALSEVPLKIRQKLARDHDPAAERCALLADGGTCAAYAARPLICRTQGLPLAYPNGVIPETSVRMRATGFGATASPPESQARELTWCPLNFQTQAPLARQSIDAGTMDEILAVVNRRYCERRGVDPLARHGIAELLQQSLGPTTSENAD